MRVLSSGVTSNEAIAAHLHVSVHTVRSQLQSALKKVNADDRTQLALWGHANLVASKPSAYGAPKWRARAPTNQSGQYIYVALRPAPVRRVRCLRVAAAA